MSTRSLDLTFPFQKERVMLLDLERNPIIFLLKKKNKFRQYLISNAKLEQDTQTHTDQII